MSKRSKLLLAGIVILLIVIIILLVVNVSDNADKEEEKIKIGIMTITSGDLAFLGNNIVQSAELAVEELGYQDKVELIVEDVGGLGSGKDAVTAYKKLVEIDQVNYIIDGMSSDGTMAVAPLLEKDKIPDSNEICEHCAYRQNSALAIKKLYEKKSSAKKREKTETENPTLF